MLFSATVILTMISSVMIGVGFGYLALMGFLRLVGHRPQKRDAGNATAVLLKQA